MVNPKGNAGVILNSSKDLRLLVRVEIGLSLAFIEDTTDTELLLFLKKQGWSEELV